MTDSQNRKSIEGRKSAVNAYVGLVFIVACLAFYWAAIHGVRSELNWASLLIWLILVISADLTPITLPRGGAVLSVGGAIDFGIILLFPTLFAAVAGVVSGVTGGLVRRIEFRKLVFNTSMNVVTMVLTSETVYFLGGKLPGTEPSQIASLPLGAMLLAYMAAAIVYFVMNTGLTSIAISISSEVPLLSIWSTNYRWTIVSSLAIVPIGFILAVVYYILAENVVLAGIGLLIFMLPLVVLRSSFKWFTDVNETYFSSIKALVSALDASHHYTQGHSQRVSENAVRVARFMRLPEREIDTIEQGAVLHDIGKIGLDKSILDKEGSLNSVEWARMKLHPILGARIIKDLGFLRAAKPIILYHHERVDGRGYPAGMTGDEIPLGARIVNVVDALDALTSNRSYRPAMTPEEALQILHDNSKKQFDSKVVKAVRTLHEQDDLVFQEDESQDEDLEILFTLPEVVEALALTSVQ